MLVFFFKKIKHLKTQGSSKRERERELRICRCASLPQSGFFFLVLSPPYSFLSLFRLSVSVWPVATGRADARRSERRVESSSETQPRRERAPQPHRRGERQSRSRRTTKTRSGANECVNLGWSSSCVGNSEQNSVCGVGGRGARRFTRHRQPTAHPVMINLTHTHADLVEAHAPGEIPAAAAFLEPCCLF